MLFRVPSQVYGTAAGIAGAGGAVTRLTTGQVAVAAPTLIAAADPLRKQIHLRVGAPFTAFVGGPGVTIATGYLIDASLANSLPSEVILTFTGAIWADAVAGKAVVYFADEGY